MPRDALANPVALPALGALLERPMHPYQLAAALAERGVPVNRGTVYDTVQALAGAGWQALNVTDGMLGWDAIGRPMTTDSGAPPYVA